VSNPARPQRAQARLIGTPSVGGSTAQRLRAFSRAPKRGQAESGLDPAKKPKEITTTNDKGKTHRSIYKLDGDALTICMSEEEGAERPTEFATKEGAKVVLVVFKREKK
jgi:hypothetical protein